MFNQSGAAAEAEAQNKVGEDAGFFSYPQHLIYILQAPSKSISTSARQDERWRVGCSARSKSV
jgi:hypothetical protein